MQITLEEIFEQNKIILKKMKRIEEAIAPAKKTNLKSADRAEVKFLEKLNKKFNS